MPRRAGPPTPRRSASSRAAMADVLSGRSARRSSRPPARHSQTGGSIGSPWSSKLPAARAAASTSARSRARTEGPRRPAARRGGLARRRTPGGRTARRRAARTAAPAYLASRAEVAPWTPSKAMTGRPVAARASSISGSPVGRRHDDAGIRGTRGPGQAGERELLVELAPVVVLAGDDQRLGARAAHVAGQPRRHLRVASHQAQDGPAVVGRLVRADRLVVVGRRPPTSRRAPAAVGPRAPSPRPPRRRRRSGNGPSSAMAPASTAVAAAPTGSPAPWATCSTPAVARTAAAADGAARGARRGPPPPRPVRHTGGRRSAHGAAASSCAASASSAPSSAGWPMSCTPSGRPVLGGRSKSGSEIAGWPEMLLVGVNGVNVAGAREGAHRVGRHRVDRADRHRRLGQRGRQQRVVLRRPGDDRRARSPELHLGEQRRGSTSMPSHSSQIAQLSGSMSSAVGSRPAMSDAEARSGCRPRAEGRGEELEQPGRGPRRVAPRRPRGRATRAARRRRGRRGAQTGSHVGVRRPARRSSSRSAAGRARGGAAAANGSAGAGAHQESPSSGPARTSSSAAVSRTVRVSDAVGRRGTRRRPRAPARSGRAAA